MAPPYSLRSRRNERRLAPLLLAGLVVLSTPATATPQSAPDASATPPAVASQPAQTHGWLRVVGDEVNIRSRADVNSQIVTRANRDDVLEAAGREYDWYKIVPPDGVFSLVAAEYVQRVAGERGVVKVDTSLRVRVGSDIQPRDPMLSEVQTRLPDKAEVRILGEYEPGWLRIAPPDGVYVYIAADFVEAIDAETAERLRAAKPAARPSPAAATSPALAGEQQPAATQPSESPALSGPWGQKLGALLEAIAAEKRKPVDQQSWNDILEDLRPIAAQRSEPQVARLAAAWVDKLEQQVRQKAALRQARELAQQAERDKARHTRELEEIDRARQRLTTPPDFDARGVLRPSFALPAGPYGLRYSLQDPFTHEVQAYVEFPPELGVDVRDALGRYVGVHGEWQPAAGLAVPLLRVTAITILNPDQPPPRPAREEP